MALSNHCPLDGRSTQFLPPSTSMNRLRVVLVTPRFWPLFGGPEDAVAELALGLKRRGAAPLVLTARWEGHWSPQLLYGLVPVIRLPHPRTPSWGTLRYLIALARWLRTHRGEIDLVYLVGAGHEASVAGSVLRGHGIPIVVRAEIPEDPRGKRRSAWRLRRRCCAADAAIVADLGATRALAEAGLPQQIIHLIADGVPDAMLEHTTDRTEARAALAEINPMLTVPAEARVVVCVGRLCQGRGLLRLIEAWQPLSHQWPGTRLWLVGDGPFREPLYARLGDLDLRLSVNMPGSFDDLGDVLAAANLLVEPSGESISPRVMLQAACLGLPVVGCNLETLRQTPLLDAGTARFASPDDVPALRRAMVEMLDNPPSADMLAAARQRVVRQYSSNRMIEEHLQLFDQLRRYS
jgi:glycosyltransferase involved in cell wall biosynthesis